MWLPRWSDRLGPYKNTAVGGRESSVSVGVAYIPPARRGGDRSLDDEDDPEPTAYVWLLQLVLKTVVALNPCLDFGLVQ
jgi:hypothetical protein